VKELTPNEIVRELDKYIVGQHAAKKAVAIALRNRWRRLQIAPDMRDEVMPKNIIMIGPTGVGKTEIARRMAGLVNAPFLKVEASRYTEVGYHGKDVETIIRDLAEVSVGMVRQEQLAAVRGEAQKRAQERLLGILLPVTDSESLDEATREQRRATREKMLAKLREGTLDKSEVEISVEEKPTIAYAAVPGMEEVGFDFQSVLENVLPHRSRTRRMTVSEARQVLTQQEADKLIDRDTVVTEGIRRAESSGIIFLDEIDKIAARYQESSGPDVSREGVQRDLLPIVEGASVNTRYGIVRTEHILFVAAGAFHMAKPSDLIPELQGRFPIRVELEDLTKDDFVRILTEPRNALTKQYKALLETEGVDLAFQSNAVDEIARIAAEVNGRAQNIGARRLQTVMERLLEDVSFRAPDMKGQRLEVTVDYVRERLQGIIADQDLSRYIL
jgi:ATP-dependent HslUV protease ATP-binding subunit HslU